MEKFSIVVKSREEVNGVSMRIELFDLTDFQILSQSGFSNIPLCDLLSSCLRAPGNLFVFFTKTLSNYFSDKYLILESIKNVFSDVNIMAHF